MKWLDPLWDNEKTLTEKLIEILKYPIGAVLLWLTAIFSVRSVLNAIAESLPKEGLLAISTLLFLLLLVAILFAYQTSKKVKNIKSTPDENAIRENKQLKYELEQLKIREARLSYELKAYTDKEAILKKYTFNDRTGTQVNKETGKHYCNKCLKGKPLTEEQLVEESAGWRCGICKEYYSNPNWQPPKQDDDFIYGH